MGAFNPVENINELIHERLRLGMMSVLVAAPRMAFTELRDLLKATDGNLSVHARILEKAGYIKIEKEFVGRKPRTTFCITPKGQEAFKKYISELETFVKKK